MQMKLFAIGLLLVCGLAISIQAADAEAKCGCHDKCATDFKCPYLKSACERGCDDRKKAKDAQTCTEMCEKEKLEEDPKQFDDWSPEMSDSLEHPRPHHGPHPHPGPHPGPRPSPGPRKDEVRKACWEGCSAKPDESDCSTQSAGELPDDVDIKNFEKMDTFLDKQMNEFVEFTKSSAQRFKQMLGIRDDDSLATVQLPAGGQANGNGFWSADQVVLDSDGIRIRHRDSEHPDVQETVIRPVMQKAGQSGSNIALPLASHRDTFEHPKMPELMLPKRGEKMDDSSEEDEDHVRDRSWGGCFRRFMSRHRRCHHAWLFHLLFLALMIACVTYLICLCRRRRRERLERRRQHHHGHHPCHHHHHPKEEEAAACGACEMPAYVIAITPPPYDTASDKKYLQLVAPEEPEVTAAPEESDDKKPLL